MILGCYLLRVAVFSVELAWESRGALPGGAGREGGRESRVCIWMTVGMGWSSVPSLPMV